MAKKAYSPDPKAETIKRIQRTEAYAEKVRQLFAATVNEILALNKSVPTLDEGVMYSFDGDNMRIQKKVEALLRQLHSTTTTAIKKGKRPTTHAINSFPHVLGKRYYPVRSSAHGTTAIWRR